MVLIHFWEVSRMGNRTVDHLMNGGVYDPKTKRLMFNSDYKMGLVDEQMLAECQYVIDSGGCGTALNVPGGYVSFMWVQ